MKATGRSLVFFVLVVSLAVLSGCAGTVPGGHAWKARQRRGLVLRQFAPPPRGAHHRAVAHSRGAHDRRRAADAGQRAIATAPDGCASGAALQRLLIAGALPTAGHTCQPHGGPAVLVRPRRIAARPPTGQTMQLLNTLYVTTPDTYLRLDNDTLRVEVNRETRLRVPLHLHARHARSWPRTIRMSTRRRYSGCSPDTCRCGIAP